MQKKYVSLSKLSTFLDNLKNTFAALGHKHTINDLTDYTVDSTLSSESTNPVQNKVLDAEFDSIATTMNALEMVAAGKADADHEHTHITNGDGTVEIVNMDLNDTLVNSQPSEYPLFALAPSANNGASLTGNFKAYSAAYLGSQSNPWAGLYLASHYGAEGKIYVDGTSYSVTDDLVNQNAFSKVTVGSTTIEADSTTDTLTLAAGSNITLTPDASGDKVTIAAKDTVYTHPNSGVTAGTYKSVTVNAQGHVTAGTNPTTLAGYGITDAESKGAADTALASAKSYADTGLSAKMNSTNPVGSGTFSFGREDGSTVGQRSIVLGSNAIASGKDTVAMGRKAKSTGNYAVSIGYNNTVSGDNAISIGVNSTASSGNSIAIGSGNTASDWDAIALGRACTASGGASTTLGMSTTASGYASLSTGYNTEAAGGAQTVLGSLNVVDDAPSGDSMKSKHLVIVGNGDLDAETQTRSNAHTLDWDGNAWFAGDVYVGGTSGTNKDDGSVKLATIDDVAAKTTVQFITWGEGD